MYAIYAMVAVSEAMTDSKLNLEQIDLDRAGVIWGSGIGGLDTFLQECGDFATGSGVPRFNPFFIPKMIADIKWTFPLNTALEALISQQFQLVHHQLTLIDAFNILNGEKPTYLFLAVQRLQLMKRE